MTFELFTPQLEKRSSNECVYAKVNEEGFYSLRITNELMERCRFGYNSLFIVMRNRIDPLKFSIYQPLIHSYSDKQLVKLSSGNIITLGYIDYIQTNLTEEFEEINYDILTNEIGTLRLMFRLERKS